MWLYMILKNSIYFFYSAAATPTSNVRPISFFYLFVCCHCVRYIYIYIYIYVCMCQHSVSKNGFSSSMPVQELAEVGILRAYHTSCFFLSLLLLFRSRKGVLHKTDAQTAWTKWWEHFWRAEKSRCVYFPFREDFGVSVKFYHDIIRLQSRLRVLEAGADGGDERCEELGVGGGGGGAVVEITRGVDSEEGCG